VGVPSASESAVAVTWTDSGGQLAPTGYFATGSTGTTQSTNVTAGHSLIPAVGLALETPQGTAIATANIPVKLGIGNNPGAGTLAGTLTALTDASGVATFPGLLAHCSQRYVDFCDQCGLDNRLIDRPRSGAERRHLLLGFLPSEQGSCHNAGGQHQQDSQKHVPGPFGAGAVRVDVFVRHYARTLTGAGFVPEPRLRRSSTYRPANGMRRVPISAHRPRA
jgi:hypothetical protein